LTVVDAPVAPTTHPGFLPGSGDLPNVPAIGGLFYRVFWFPSLQAGQVANFGALSPALKFPFLAPKRCGAKSFAPKLSLLLSDRALKRRMKLGLRQTEPLELARPFGWSIT
jgi:hypothetical protein